MSLKVIIFVLIAIFIFVVVLTIKLLLKQLAVYLILLLVVLIAIWYIFPNYEFFNQEQEKEKTIDDLIKENQIERIQNVSKRNEKDIQDVIMEASKPINNVNFI